MFSNKPVRCHGIEHDSGATKSGHDQLRPVSEMQDVLDHAREHQAHKEGEAQQQDHAHAGVFGALYAIKEAEGDREKRDEAQHGAASEQREVHLHPKPGTQHRWQHGQGQ